MQLYQNHYKYLDEKWVPFLKMLSIKNPDTYYGVIVAHGDKAEGCKEVWKQQTNTLKEKRYGM